MPRPDSTDNVFINCPFDKSYAPLFQALVFTVYACRFRPRSAREMDDSGEVRIEKIFGIIEDCRYGIHDISRTQLDPKHRLPRFNMPLELGLFLGAKRYGGSAHKQKRILIFDTEQYRYQKFISDLAGMDIHEHKNDVSRLIRETRDWLASVSRRTLVSGARILKIHKRFVKAYPAILRELGLDSRNVPYVDFERIVVSWLTKTPA